MTEWTAYFIASSDPLNGAVNISPDGSSFEHDFDIPLGIPLEATNVRVSVVEADIWWTVPNVITGQNDLMRIVDTGTDSGVAATYNLVLPQGLYDLAGLNQTVLRELSNAGAPVSPALINISADDSTQKMEITTNYIGISIDFTIAQSVRDIMGFNSQVLGPTVTKPLTFVADDVAQLNTVNYFRINSDIVDKGIRIGGKYSRTISKVLITETPGSQIKYVPFRPITSPAPNLRGSNRTNFRFFLTDDVGNSVNTAGDHWSAIISIQYTI